MQVTTTDNLQGIGISRYLGVVASQSLLAIPLWKNLLMSFRNRKYAAERDLAVEQQIDQGVEEAIREVSDKARKAGADAVLGLRINVERAGDQGVLLGISATGTAAVTQKTAVLEEEPLSLAREGVLMTTTASLEGQFVEEYLGPVHSYVILLPAITEDVVLIMKEMWGGRNKRYEKVFDKGLQSAFTALADKARKRGANGVIGIQVAFEHTGGNGYVLMAALTGTAVRLREAAE